MRMNSGSGRIVLVFVLAGDCQGYACQSQGVVKDVLVNHGQRAILVFAEFGRGKAWGHAANFLLPLGDT